MSNVNLISAIIAGAQRQVDLSANTLLVLDLRINGINLRSATTGTEGTRGIGDFNSYSNFTPAAATLKGALSGIDTALAASGTFANKSLNNLTSTSVNQDLIPSGDATENLGSASNRWLQGSIVTLADSSNTGAINTEIRRLLDSGGTRTVDWDNLELWNSGTKVVDWGRQELFDSGAALSVHWDSKQLYSSGQSVLNWGSNTITDNSGNESIDWGARTLHDLAGATALDFSGASLDASSRKIVNVLTPTLSQDAATKSYVDTAIAALNPAEACYAASTASITGTYNNGTAGVGATFTVTATGAFTIDSVTPPINSRILIKDQSSGFQNGIYTLTTTGVGPVSPVLTRAVNYNTPTQMNVAGLIPIIQGTVNSLSSWQQTATIVTVGTTALVFQEFTANPSLYLLKANNLSDVSSKSSSFNNLSPMTTGGDIIYGGASGTGTRLANGSSGQYLQSNGTTLAPTWAGLAGTLTGSATLNVLTSALGNLTDAGTDGIVVTGGTSAVVGAVSIAQHVADTSHNGYLSSTDWNTFNGKQASGNYVTALTGDVTATGPGSVAATVAKIQGTTVSGTTGSGNVVFSTNGVLVTPNLGTPSSLVGTNISGTAASLTAGNVTTNHNMTGPITGTGNVTSITAQTGTGTTFVMDTSPTLVTPNLGTPSALVGTNISGTAASLTAGHVTTNANLTGDVTSVGNAATLAATTNATLTTISTLVSIGTITTGVWNAGTITSSKGSDGDNISIKRTGGTNNPKLLLGQTEATDTSYVTADTVSGNPILSLRVAAIEGLRIDYSANGQVTIPVGLVVGGGTSTQGYQTSSPISTGTVTGAANTPGVLLTPLTTLATLTIKLPPSPVDGMQWWIATSQTITSVTYQDSGGTAGNVVGGLASLATSGARFVFSSGTSKWYSIA